MKLFFKITLGLFALILIAAIGFAVTFNPNDYKDEIITLVKDKTGRDLTIKGDISLSLFPWIGIDLGAIEISNAKGFGKQAFAQMEHFQVRAKLWPLIKQQLEADIIVIDGLKLNLAKNKNGINNWDDLTQTPKQAKANKTQTKSTAKPSTKTNQSNNTKGALAAIALNGLKIKNAQFNWHDKQLKQKVTIKDIQLNIGALKPVTKIPLNLQFQLEEKSLDAEIKFESELLFSADYKQFSFYDTQLGTDLKLASIKKHLSPQLNSALIQLDLKKQTFEAKELNLSEGALKLQTKTSVTHLFSTPYITSQLVISPFNLRAYIETYSIKLPAMEDTKTLTKLNAQLNLKGSLSNINVTNIELSLDDTNIVGNAKIKPNKGTSVVNLVVDKINIDRYLAKPTPRKASAKPKSSLKANTTQDEAVLIPVALLSKVDLDTSFKIKKIQIKQTHWSNFNFVTHSKNGNIQIKPLSMQGYDATIKSNFNIKVKKDNALLSGNLNIKSLKIGKLLNDYIGKDKLRGRTTIAASINTSGLKLSQLKQNLNGTLNFNLQDGTLKGFDLDHQLKVLDAKIKAKTIPETPNPQETKIAKLHASAIIKKGVLINKDLSAVTPLSRVKGQGTVDIAKEKLNYTATIKFASAAELKADTPFSKIKSFPLDIRITGSFDEPSIKPDFQKVLNNLVKKELKKHEKKIKDKVTNDLKKALEKNLGKDLKNLFKR